MKTDHLIATPRKAEQLPFHSAKAEQMKATDWVYMDSSLVPESDLLINIRKVDFVPPGLPPETEPHSHEASSSYCVIGDVTLEVIIEGNTHRISGPGSVFIPAGARHQARVIAGSGYIMMVLRNGEYQASM
ncbi:hypothetical protein ACFLWX_00345 [Chloroflexota bacterium]